MGRKYDLKLAQERAIKEVNQGKQRLIESSLRVGQSPFLVPQRPSGLGQNIGPQKVGGSG